MRIDNCRTLLCNENKNRTCSFCESRSKCEKRKAIWDACVAEIKEDPDEKKEFDVQMLAAMDLMGQ